MEAIVILVVLVLVGVLVSLIASRRGSQAPTAPSYSAPSQVDPEDFSTGDSIANVVMFGSQSCQGCADMAAAIEELAASDTSVVQMFVMNEKRPELFEKYNVDGIPSTLVITDEGIVSDSFFGVTTSERLSEAFTKLQTTD